MKRAQTVSLVEDTWTGQCRAYGVGRVPKTVLAEIRTSSRYVLKTVPKGAVLGLLLASILS